MRLAPDAYVPLSVRAAVAEAIKAADAGSMPLEWAQMHAALDVLADADRIARPLPTREEIAMSIAARHWDRDSGDVEVWHDLTDSEKENVAENYLTWDSADAVLELLKGTQQ